MSNNFLNNVLGFAHAPKKEQFPTYAFKVNDQEKLLGILYENCEIQTNEGWKSFRALRFGLYWITFEWVISIGNEEEEC